MSLQNHVFPYVFTLHLVLTTMFPVTLLTTSPEAQPRHASLALRSRHTLLIVQPRYDSLTVRPRHALFILTALPMGGEAPSREPSTTRRFMGWLASVAYVVSSLRLNTISRKLSCVRCRDELRLRKT